MDGPVVISGASGLVGRALCRLLAAEGREVVALSRRPGSLPGVAASVTWDELRSNGWTGRLDGADAVVHLAGATIAERWSAARRRLILDSRAGSGRLLAEAIAAAPRRPQVFLQASAAGYYGSRGDEVLTEESPPGSGFLADVCRQWEASTAPLAALGVRHVVARSAMVLDAAAGALPRLVRPFRWGAGGRLGGGRQWVAWIHLRDEVKALRFLLADERCAGAFNLAAPGTLRQRDLARLLGRQLGRPAWLPAPAPLLRLLLGGMADELLLASQRIHPRRLLEAGFQFGHASLADALAAVVLR